MKSKITLLSVLLISWGSFAQASGRECPCVDKETLTINSVYHVSALALDQAVVARLQNPELITMVKTTDIEHDAKIKELSAISVNAGIPYKPSDISQGFEARAQDEISLLKNLSGTDLDRAYLEFRANELQRLLTAFDTYFITDVTTPTMKAWVATERPLLGSRYDAARALQQKLISNFEMSY